MKCFIRERVSQEATYARMICVIRTEDGVYSVGRPITTILDHFSTMSDYILSICTTHALSLLSNQQLQGLAYGLYRKGSF